MPIPKADRVGWILIAFLCALGLAMALTASIAKAETSSPPLSLGARLNVALHVLPTYKDDTAEELRDAKEQQLADLSAAIASVTNSREWAALVATVAYSESGLSLRLFRGECRPHECDSRTVNGERVFAAWSPWQQHKNKLNESVWGSPGLTVQASEAAKMLKRAFYTCNRGQLRADWPARTLTSYSGRRCDAIWPGLETRLATYRRIVGRL